MAGSLSRVGILHLRVSCPVLLLLNITPGCCDDRHKQGRVKQHLQDLEGHRMESTLVQREAPVTRHHVLLVDDEELSVELLKRIFAAEPDIEVTGTTSPLAALELASRQPVDLVIVDQRMPEMSGVDFLIELHRIRPQIVPVMLTAYPELSLVIRALNDASTYRFL